MTRIKVMGLALVAVFAMGALASSAMAAPTLEAGNANVNLTGEQAPGTNDVFNIEGSKVTCTEAMYNANGVTANGGTNAVLHPVYGNCTAFGFIGATVNVATGCNYRGMATGSQDANMFYNTGELQIECTNPTNEFITISVSNCVMHVKAQNISSGIAFSNTTPANNTNEKMDFDLHAVNAPVNVQVTSNCFGGPPVNATQGNYNGTTTVRAFNPTNGTQTNATING